MALSGVKAVTTAGTQVALGTQVVRGPLAVKALSTNAGLVFIGDKDVSSANGYPLAKNEELVFKSVKALDRIFVDSAEDGDGVAWIDLGY